MSVRDWKKEAVVSFEGAVVVRESEKAILVTFEGDDDAKEHWIPKSQISPESDVASGGDRGTLVITEWVASEKGLT